MPRNNRLEMEVFHKWAIKHEWVHLFDDVVPEGDSRVITFYITPHGRMVSVEYTKDNGLIEYVG